MVSVERLYSYTYISWPSFGQELHTLKIFNRTWNLVAMVTSDIKMILYRCSKGRSQLQEKNSGRMFFQGCKTPPHNTNLMTFHSDVLILDWPTRWLEKRFSHMVMNSMGFFYRKKSPVLNKSKASGIDLW